MKQHTEHFTPAALTLSIVTAALVDGVPQTILSVSTAGVKCSACCFMTAVSPSPAFARY